MRIDKELEDLVNSGELKLESRRFSSFDSEIRMQASSLNLASIINYLSEDLSTQLRYILMAVSRFKKKDKNRLGLEDQYLANELARIILSAKSEMKVNGGTLSSILQLTRYGNVINKLSNSLSRYIIRAEREENKKGFISKEITENIQNLYGKLLLEFKKFTEGDKQIDPEVKTQSNKEDFLGDTEFEYKFKLKNEKDLSELEDFIDELKVGIYTLEVIDGNVEIVFHDELSSSNKSKLNKYIKSIIS
jgi:hypothetical protein